MSAAGSWGTKDRREEKKRVESEIYRFRDTQGTLVPGAQSIKDQWSGNAVSTHTNRYIFRSLLKCIQMCELVYTHALAHKQAHTHPLG